MRNTTLYVILVIASFLTAPCLFAQTGNCVCSGFNNARVDSGWSFTEGAMFSRARANLTDPAFFGATGVVPRGVTVGRGIQYASEGTLAGIDVFFTGWTTTTSYGPDEKTALTNAINSGMNLVATTDDLGHNLADLFSVTLDDNGEEMNFAALPEHPIFAGPFGRITQFRGAGQNGYYRAWPTRTLLLASSGKGPSMLLIPRGTLASGAGAVLLLSDVDQLTSFSRDIDPNSSEASVPVTDALVMNIVAFLCNPTAPAAAPHLVFPQIANGETPGVGKNLSSLNLTNIDSQNPTSATISFRDDNGAPYSLNLAGLGAASTFSTGNMPSNQTLTFTTDGAGTVKSGTAIIRGSSPLLAGNVIFFVPGLGATGVGASEMAGGYVLPVVQQPTAGPPPAPAGVVNVATGLAVSNLSAKTANIRLELWDTSGRRSDGIAFTTLPGYGHFAKYLFQLYPSFDFREFKGTLRIVSTNGLIAVAALQLGSSPGQFTALPARPIYR